MGVVCRSMRKMYDRKPGVSSLPVSMVLCAGDAVSDPVLPWTRQIYVNIIVLHLDW